MTNSTTAILFFSKRSSEDAKTKNWFTQGHDQKNKQLAKQLISKTSQSLHQVGLPVFHFHEGNQIGNSFGERLANAFQELYNKGFQSVIAVGNDSPDIIDLDWKAIESNLANGNAVLGKSIRGGAYLIGLGAQDFDIKQFQNLPWQSNELYAALKGSLSVSSINELAILRDINSIHDLIKWLKSTTDIGFRKIIHAIFLFVRQFKFITVNFFTVVDRITQLRAPPIS